MFGQKYQKQLEALLPFMQQGKQQQQRYIANKQNSSNGQQLIQECITPDYKGIQDDYQQHLAIQSSEIKIINRIGCNNYASKNQAMMISQQIRGISGMHEKYIPKKAIDKKDSSQSLGTNNLRFNTLPTVRKYSEDFNIKSDIQQFHNFIDSNFAKSWEENNQNQDNSIKQKSQTNSKDIHKLTNKNTNTKIINVFSDIIFNGQPISAQLLNQNPKLRWELLMNLISLNQQCQQKKSKKSPEKTSKLTINQIQKQLHQSLQSTQKQFIQAQKVSLLQNSSLLQLLSNKDNLISHHLADELEQIQEIRENYEQRALMKYQQIKQQTEILYEENFMQTSNDLYECLGKRFQKANLQIVRQKRISKHHLQKQYNYFLSQLQAIQKEITEQDCIHNQKITKSISQIEQKYEQFNKSIASFREQHRTKSSYINQKIYNMQNLFNVWLNKEITEGQEMKSHMLELLQKLTQKIQNYTVEINQKDTD